LRVDGFQHLVRNVVAASESNSPSHLFQEMNLSSRSLGGGNWLE
jgi:hypothetical protein